MSQWTFDSISFHRRRSLYHIALVLFLACCTLATTLYLGLWSSLSFHHSSYSHGPVLWPVDTAANTAAMGAASDLLPDLNDFLAETKAAALKHLGEGGGDGRPLVLIMGNGAGDLDSFSSAISLAYLLAHYPAQSLPLSSPLPTNARFAPLIQTARSDLRLRPENVAAAAAAGIQQEHILYLSDITDVAAASGSRSGGSSNGAGGLALDLASAEVFTPSKNTWLGLVDHPQLELPWHGSSLRHVSILVDHHADAGKHADASLRVFREPEGSADGKGNPTGSAQSVILDLFAAEIEEKGLPRELADLAMSSILIDTDNLRRPPRGRASDTDMNAMELLLPRSSLSTLPSSQQLQQALLQNAPEEVSASSFSSWNDQSSVEGVSGLASKTQGIWQILSASKNAVSHLTTLELLKRDYKTSSLSSSEIPQSIASFFPSQELKVGFSSVNLGLPVWLHRSGGEEMGVESETQSRRDWDDWWKALTQWMESQKLSVAVVGTSFTDQEKQRHKRELILAFSPPASFPDPSHFFNTLSELLEVPSPLDLTTPWKGARLRSTGKKERVSGLDQQGLVTVEGLPRGDQAKMWAQVWSQQATRANRKVYLPIIMSALQKVAKGL